MEISKNGKEMRIPLKLIHNSELSIVQKHEYFGSLSDPAAKIIESIETSKQNYLIACELLKQRYEDEKVIRR